MRSCVDATGALRPPSSALCRSFALRLAKHHRQHDA
jgi:hypothetical protein